MKTVDLPVDNVREQLASGASYRELAKRYGCSVGHIATFAKEHGFARAKESDDGAAGPPRRGPGRPRADAAPNPLWNQIDRDLVEGELVPGRGGMERRYKTYRELADEHGISPSLISRYATEHRCLERRQQRGGAVELEATAPAASAAPPPSTSRPSLVERKQAIQHRLLDQIDKDLDEGKVATHVFKNILDLLEQIADDSGEAGSPELWAASIVAQIAARQPILIEQRRIALANPALTGARKPVVVTQERVVMGAAGSRTTNAEADAWMPETPEATREGPAPDADTHVDVTT
jgi:hypothetical protein